MSYKITDRLNLFLNTSFYQLIGKKGNSFKNYSFRLQKPKICGKTALLSILHGPTLVWFYVNNCSLPTYGETLWRKVKPNYEYWLAIRSNTRSGYDITISRNMKNRFWSRNMKVPRSIRQKSSHGRPIQVASFLSTHKSVNLAGKSVCLAVLVTWPERTYLNILLRKRGNV